MCLSCGCCRASDTHDDPRNITLLALQGAADAAGIPLEQAAKNIASCVEAAAEKGELGGLVAVRVVKATSEQRFTLGVAYPAMKADAQRAADGHRDFVSPRALEKTAWEWLTKYRDVNLFHQDNTVGHFTPTESYIWRGPDWEIESPVDGKRYVVKAGDWMLGGVWDDLGWAYCKARLVNGWSPEGGARRSQPSAERLAQLRSR